MDTISHHTLIDEFAALCDWWLEAGVGHAFSDAPRALLADAPLVRPDTPEAPPPQDRGPRWPALAAAAGRRASPAGDAPVGPALRDPLPASLADFQAWWGGADNAWLGQHLPPGLPRIAPQGEAGAPLLLLAPMPEEGDASGLLQGRQGQMLDSIVRALGMEAAQCYRATALPAFVGLPDWGQLAEAGLGAILAHHLALAQPRKILVFGRNLERMLKDQGRLEGGRMDLAGKQVAVFTAVEPALLLDRPGARMRLWHDLLEWTAAQ